MATTTKSKKNTKASRKPKPKPDAARTERLRKSVLKEINERIAQGEKTTTGTDASLHDAMITRGDGEVVRVSVPADHSEQGGPAEAPTTTKPSKPKKPKGEKAPRQPKPPREKKPKKISALDAAATVLADTKQPMRAIDLVAEAQKRGLWASPKGKTPESSLYAAMIREIAAKGNDARFKKADKGLFVSNTPASA